MVMFEFEHVCGNLKHVMFCFLLRVRDVTMTFQNRKGILSGSFPPNPLSLGFELSKFDLTVASKSLL